MSSRRTKGSRSTNPRPMVRDGRTGKMRRMTSLEMRQAAWDGAPTAESAHNVKKLPDNYQDTRRPGSQRK